MIRLPQPTSARRFARTEFNGVVVGDPDVGQVDVARVGAAVLLSAFTVATAVAVLWLLLRVLESAPAYAGGVVPAVVVAVVVITVGSLVLGQAPGRALGGFARLLGMLARSLLSVFATLITSVLRMTLGNVRSPGGSSARSITVVRFRVSVGMETRECLVHGQLVGAPLRHGDQVTVTGRQSRHGHWDVATVRVLDGQGGRVRHTVRVAPGPNAGSAQAMDRTFLVVGLILYVAVASLVAGYFW